ncbi:MAG: nicotinate-nucleotide diphosphorylase (carboxylating), partial [Spirochaetes bacterium]|nr:nicotinate-nucleotide diphosphorylase (carboxylating) [Spirochaetota bacterium]
KNKHLKILDTRKTIPLYRSLEKYAVKTGGCHNHRMGLYDMIMLKENHIKAAGSILEAVKKCRAKYPNLKIEVETTNLEEVKEAVRAGSSIVMFDNMNDSEIIKALEITKNNCLTEASGNMDENRITALADTGLDYISVGSLTHSVQVFDFSMILN